MDNIQLAREHNRIKFRDHLTGAKFSQIPAPLTGWAAGVFGCESAKVSAINNLLFQLFTGGFIVYQNVSC